MSTIEHFSSCGTLHYVVVKPRNSRCKRYFSALLNLVTSDEKAAYLDPLVVAGF